MALSPEIEAVVTKTIGCAIAVHTALGPGLLESVYRECMLVELAASELAAQAERRVPLVYRGQKLSDSLKLDLLVEDNVIIEVKAVERIHPVHVAQLITYLKLTDRPAGLLINFNTPSLRSGGIRRVTHPALYKKSTL